MNNLLKKLFVLQHVNVIGWNFQSVIRNLINTGHIELVKGGYHSKWNKDKTFDIKDKNIWTHSEECIVGKIYIQNDSIIIEFITFTGEESLVRDPKEWTATLKLVNFKSERFLSYFRSEIDYSWNNQLDILFNKEELAKKQKRIAEIESELLGNS